MVHSRSLHALPTRATSSRNGHMFSFLDAEGALALRLSDELTEEFLSTYESGPVTQYGSVV